MLQPARGLTAAADTRSDAAAGEREDAAAGERSDDAAGAATMVQRPVNAGGCRPY